MNLKILLINNRESTQVNLENFLKKYGRVDVIHFQSISILAMLRTYLFQRPDLIVLSGSGDVPLGFSLDLYRDELEMIKTAPFPIIGVCFGFEAITAAYNEKLIKKENKIQGIFDVNYKNKKVSVWQNHFWCLENTNNLEVLGDSVNGIEVIKVPNKKIYGIQFHPEHIDEKNNGREIFEDILNVIFTK